ncbi:NAD(P)-dependent oxidoreductase [Bordetella sp. 02P26C-1]|uniref:NAD(P)-dependent oxidoreductase n=1 Tax=Bordetella sp. 02P26C-1 TaxID=2683195 RepID=UPI0013559D44|nr:NAD(P)-dependent oxidoreductase [Bordetella sp. 02P26C-1]MVW78107.1 NAD-binding protein [Bordetella sp. 02P26C-1]
MMSSREDSGCPADPQTVACIGLGIMGQAMACRLIGAGFDVRGVDPNPQAANALAMRGAQMCASPAVAAASAQCAIIMVSNATQVRAVLFGPEGIVHTMPRAGVVWIASTIPADVMRECARRLSEYGLTPLDGPVSGGRRKAQAGTLTVIAGGSQAALEGAMPYLSACAAQIHHVGETGVASTIKIINNLLAASHVVLTAEALALGARTGVALDKLIEVVGCSSGASQMFLNRASRMTQGDHEVHASIDTFLKDLDIALASAQSLGASVPVSRAARAVLARAAQSGMGPHSDTELFDLYQAARALSDEQ